MEHVFAALPSDERLRLAHLRLWGGAARHAYLWRDLLPENMPPREKLKLLGSNLLESVDAEELMDRRNALAVLGYVVSPSERRAMLPWILSNMQWDFATMVMAWGLKREDIDGDMLRHMLINLSKDTFGNMEMVRDCFRIDKSQIIPAFNSIVSMSYLDKTKRVATSKTYSRVNKMKTFADILAGANAIFRFTKDDVISIIATSIT